MTRIDLGQHAIVMRRAGASPRAVSRPVSLHEAVATAGFTILQPTYRPSSALLLARVDLILDPGAIPEGASRVISRYHEAAGRWLVLQQAKLGAAVAESREVAIPVDAHHGQVGESPAAFFAYPIAAEALPGGLLTITRCVWERDGCLLDLQAPHLSAAELAQIGASLREVR
jgi:hypothetical protein